VSEGWRRDAWHRAHRPPAGLAICELRCRHAPCHTIHAVPTKSLTSRAGGTTVSSSRSGRYPVVTVFLARRSWRTSTLGVFTLDACGASRPEGSWGAFSRPPRGGESCLQLDERLLESSNLRETLFVLSLWPMSHDHMFGGLIVESGFDLERVGLPRKEPEHRCVCFGSRRDRDESPADC
jgi:hypothetical protein